MDSASWRIPRFIVSPSKEIGVYTFIRTLGRRLQPLRNQEADAENVKAEILPNETLKSLVGCPTDSGFFIE